VGKLVYESFKLVLPTHFINHKLSLVTGVKCCWDNCYGKSEEWEQEQRTKEMSGNGIPSLQNTLY